jgi:hypothetical protein
VIETDFKFVKSKRVAARRSPETTHTAPIVIKPIFKFVNFKRVAEKSNLAQNSNQLLILINKEDELNNIKKANNLWLLTFKKCLNYSGSVYHDLY